MNWLQKHFKLIVDISGKSGDRVFKCDNKVVKIFKSKDKRNNEYNSIQFLLSFDFKTLTIVEIVDYKNEYLLVTKFISETLLANYILQNEYCDAIAFTIGKTLRKLHNINSLIITNKNVLKKQLKFVKLSD